jgi:hypothetical protein
VFARTITDAWAVGQQFVAAGQPPAPPAIYYWNGTAWSLVSSPALPQAGALVAVSASSANGTSWTIVPSPSPGFDPALTGIAARSATDVYAVGQGQPSVNGGPFRAVILRWNGTSWTDDTGGATFGVTEAASTFPGAATEWAVGITSANQGQILCHS